jgi:hypothetical protein
MPFCSRCGKEIEGTDKHCNACGQAAKKRPIKYVGMLLGFVVAVVWGTMTGFQVPAAFIFCGVPGGLVGFAVGAVIDQYTK